MSFGFLFTKKIRESLDVKDLSSFLCPSVDNATLPLHVTSKHFQFHPSVPHQYVSYMLDSASFSAVDTLAHYDTKKK